MDIQRLDGTLNSYKSERNLKIDDSGKLNATI